MEDRDKILDYTKPVRLPDDCSKNRKNFTQGYYYREIGRYKNAVPSEFQWAAEDKLINKTTYEELKCQLPDSPRSTFLMVFSPDGKKVASTHGNHNVYVTDLTTGKNIQTLSGHPRTPWCIAFHPSSNQILASGCLGGQVRVWDLHGGSEVWTTETQTVIASLAFHPIDRMLVIATYNELHFWDWSQPEPFAKCSTKSGREKVRYVSFDRLGNKLITGIANPVSAPSQWDRINVVSSQPPMTSTTTTTTSSTSTGFNSTPPTTIVSPQLNEHIRSITSWYRNSINRYNQLLSISRTTPTIDRGTDPMDLLDLRSNRNNNSESSTSNPSPSTSNPQATSSSSPLRFKITRSACRSYRPLSYRERFRIDSSVFRRLRGRSSHSSSSAAPSTVAGHSSVFSNPSTSSPSTSTSTSRDTYIPRLRRCTFSLSPTARTWCLTLSPENSSSLFSTRNTTNSTTSTGAVTNPTFTSYPDRGIFSTRESSSSNSETTQFSVVRPYRLLFDDVNEGRTTSQRDTQSDPERETGNEQRSNSLLNAGQSENHRTPRNNLNSHSPESPRSSHRDLRLHSPEIEIEGELRRPASGQRRQETESTESNRESPYSSELFRNNRSIFQLIPVNLRNISPVRRFRDDANSDGELTETSRRENHSLPQSLMHPRPVPRFQLRSRLLQDQQSQLHLLTNRETHGLNLQNNQSLRRQLSFRPGGQYVLSRHSNSPFQPRVPHQSDGPTQMNASGTSKNNDSRFETSSHRTSFNTSTSASASEVGTSSSSSSTGNPFSLNSVASNLSFTGEGFSHQLPEQINRRLFDRVKMMLRDRIRNSSENASTDSTVNYSRLSGESEAERDPLDCEDGIASRGLGPRGTDPMLSSVSENLDSTNELLHNSGSSSPISGNVNGVTSNGNNLNTPQSDLLDLWEPETDTTPFSISAPLSLNDILNDQPQSGQETSSQNEVDSAQQNQASTTSNNGNTDTANTSSPEFSMRQGIQLLSLHIENMQRLCWARIEILQLQKIRRMWEDLTNQIRQFHNIIQNRTVGENATASGVNDASNSTSDIPGMRNLAISSSPVPERNPESSASSETPNNASIDSFRNTYRELVENNELLNEGQQSTSQNASSSAFQKSNNSLEGVNVVNRNTSSDNKSSRSEVEEPQPGPSGLSNLSSSGGVRNSILQLEYRVYKLLRDIIQKTRRRREIRDLGTASSSGFQRHNQPSGIRSSFRTKIRSHRYGRLDSSTSRSRALNRALEAIWQTWRNEKTASKTSQTAGPSGSCDTSEPSTSTQKASTSSDACQSCGQKKKPVKEFFRQKRRSMDSSNGSDISGSASKILKNNVGERSEAPSNESQETETPRSPSPQPQDTSTNDLLKQMLQTMETMLHFQRGAFQNAKEGSRGHSSRQTSNTVSSGEDSDSDQNESNDQREMSMRRGARESIVNSMQDIAQLRAKRLLGFMVKSLNQFFGKNFRNLNEVLDEQIFSLYMLLDLALELTDLLLEQLNARSRDLERNWGVNNPENRDRNWTLPKTGGSAERMRERNRRPYIPLYSTIREDPRYRFSTNPFLRSHASLISGRHSSAGTSSNVHERYSPSALSSSCRRKRATARISTGGLPRWYYRRGRTPSQAGNSSSNSAPSNRSLGGSSFSNRYRSLYSDRRSTRDDNLGLRVFDCEINNNSNNNNDTNNNYSPIDDRNTSRNNNTGGNNNPNNNNNNNSANGGNGGANNGNNPDNRSTTGASSSGDISSNNNSFLNYYFPNNGNSSSNSENGNNIIIMTGLSSSSDSRNNPNNSTQSGSNVSFLNLNSLPPLRSMELTLSRNESGDLSLRDERPIFWIRYGGNSESSGTLSNNDSQSRVSSFTVPVVQVNDVPVSDVSMLNQPRHRPQSPVPRVSEDIWRWRAWRPRFLHPRYGGPNPFDDQDSNDVPENIHYYRILSTSVGSHLGVYTLDPMIITDAPMSPHHRIQAWDFSKMNIPDISDREANGVVPECKIHNDASVDVSNDGHLLVTLLPSGRLSVTTMLGVYSLDWNSLGQLLYRTSFEQNAVSVSLSPTNRHLLVGLASRPVVVRDRTNMAQIFRLEGGRPSPHGGSWQSGRGRLVHMRDLEQTREMNIMSLNCIRWAPGAGQGLVYGTNTGQLKVLR